MVPEVRVMGDVPASFMRDLLSAYRFGVPVRRIAEFGEHPGAEDCLSSRLFIAVYVVVVIGFFAVIITGKWPDSLRAFVIGVMRWAYRVSISTYLMTDKYPPFSLD